MADIGCTIGIENKQRIIALEDRADRQDSKLDEMAKDIINIRDNLLNRPTWITSNIITLLGVTTAAVLGWGLTLIRFYVIQ